MHSVVFDADQIDSTLDPRRLVGRFRLLRRKRLSRHQRQYLIEIDICRQIETDFPRQRQS